jgi:hypothetical protein
MAVLAPIPSASVSTATMRNTRWRVKTRKANRTSAGSYSLIRYKIAFVSKKDIEAPAATGGKSGGYKAAQFAPGNGSIFRCHRT